MDFAGFEVFFVRPGPWVRGMDLPFGQPRSLVSALGRPEAWEGYVGEVVRLSKEEFEGAVRADMALRTAGSTYRYRLADKRSDSSSAMMLFRVPVGKMFYRGAPRLLEAGVRVEPYHRTEDARVAVETYPTVVARRFLRRASYKNDERKKQTTAMRAAGRRSSPALGPRSLRGLRLRGGDGRLVGEGVRPGPGGRRAGLAALRGVCSVGVREGRRELRRVPPEYHPNEGWILDPELLTSEKV